jgi:hypothetical protein
MKISDKIIKQTTECHANFSCLNGKEYPTCTDGLGLCAVEEYIGHDMVFVDFSKKSSCNYSILFGSDSKICIRHWTQ